MEKRLLLAFVVSAVIFAVWSLLFPPAKPPAPPGPEQRAEPTAAVPVSPPARAAAPPEWSSVEVAGGAEELVELASPRVAVTLSNRGAAITSYRLIDYRTDEGEVLDLIQSVDHPRRALPLQLLEGDVPDGRVYASERSGDELEFRWSDGAGSAVSKRLSVAADGYGIEFEITASGALEGAAVSLGTGLRDLGEVERDSRLARWGDAVFMADGNFEVVRRDKLKQPLLVAPESVAFVGLQDAYFMAVLRPAGPVGEVRIDPLALAPRPDDPKAKPQPVLQALVRPAGGELAGELLGAPKEYRLLREIGGGVERTLDFGFFGPISVLFLKALWWIYGAVGNYGLAIVLLTVAIRLLLFPLMHSSTVSMRKMQKLQPRIKEIQARYKKKKGDPQARARMNQEVMALYKDEGVNPMGGCLPMLVQLPILWALYTLFLHAIELRHAPFMLWIQDLSAKDPYYITPILMTATMWLQQRLAPQVGDPQQQRIMRLMPLIFGIMFLQFPSGLVLYWLTNNIISIVQQEVTLHLVGERSRGKAGGTGK